MAELTMEEHAIISAYRAGMKNGIREYAVWKNGGQFVGVMLRPLREVLAAVDEVPAEKVLRCALSQMLRDGRG